MTACIPHESAVTEISLRSANNEAGLTMAQALRCHSAPVGHSFRIELDRTGVLTDHSARSATIGSTRAARRAGTYAAIAPIAMSTSGTVTITDRSRDDVA